jgi:hypothetical protein
MDGIAAVPTSDGTWVLPAGVAWDVPILGELLEWIRVNQSVRITDTHVHLGLEKRPWSHFESIWLTGGLDEPEQLTLVGRRASWVLIDTEALLEGTPWTVDGLHRFALALSERTGLPLHDQLPDWRTWIEHSVDRFHQAIAHNARLHPELHALDAPAGEQADLDGVAFTVQSLPSRHVDSTQALRLHRGDLQLPNGHRIPLARLDAVGVTYHQVDANAVRAIVWGLVGDRQLKLLRAQVRPDGHPTAGLNAIVARIANAAEDAYAAERKANRGTADDVPGALADMRTASPPE